MHALFYVHAYCYVHQLRCALCVLQVRGLDKAFGLLRVNELRMEYSGGAFVNYDMELTLNDKLRSLRFRLPRLPTTRADFFVLIAQLGVEILQSLAPLDATLSLPTAESAPICSPTLPCNCDCQLGCSRRRLHTNASAINASAANEGANGTVVGSGNQGTQLGAAYRPVSPDDVLRFMPHGNVTHFTSTLLEELLTSSSECEALRKSGKRSMFFCIPRLRWLLQ